MNTQKYSYRNNSLACLSAGGWESGLTDKHDICKTLFLVKGT